MAFKLGREKGLQASGGNIKSKFKFRTENEAIPGTPVFKKDLGDGILAEANMDGAISVDKDLDLESAYGKKVIKHEKKHLEQIKSGKGTYTDKFVTWKGEKYARKGGKIFYKLKWYDEGDKNLPWEKEAIAAESDKSTKKITDGRAQSAAFQK